MQIVSALIAALHAKLKAETLLEEAYICEIARIVAAAATENLTDCEVVWLSGQIRELREIWRERSVVRS